MTVFGMGGRGQTGTEQGNANAAAAAVPLATKHALQLTATKREWTVGCERWDDFIFIIIIIIIIIIEQP